MLCDTCATLHGSVLILLPPQDAGCSQIRKLRHKEGSPCGQGECGAEPCGCADAAVCGGLCLPAGAAGAPSSQPASREADPRGTGSLGQSPPGQQRNPTAHIRELHAPMGAHWSPTLHRNADGSVPHPVTPLRGRGGVTAAPGPVATQHTPGPAATRAATSVCPTTGALSFDSSNARLLGRNVCQELPCSGSHVPAPGPLAGGVCDVKVTKVTTGGQRPRPHRPRLRCPRGILCVAAGTSLGVLGTGHASSGKTTFPRRQRAAGAGLTLLLLRGNSAIQGPRCLVPRGSCQSAGLSLPSGWMLSPLGFPPTGCPCILVRAPQREGAGSPLRGVSRGSCAPPAWLPGAL